MHCSSPGRQDGPAPLLAPGLCNSGGCIVLLLLNSPRLRPAVGVHMGTLFFVACCQQQAVTSSSTVCYSTATNMRKLKRCYAAVSRAAPARNSPDGAQALHTSTSGWMAKMQAWHLTNCGVTHHHGHHSRHSLWCTTVFAECSYRQRSAAARAPSAAGHAIDRCTHTPGAYQLGPNDIAHKSTHTYTWHVCRASQLQPACMMQQQSKTHTPAASCPLKGSLSATACRQHTVNKWGEMQRVVLRRKRRA